MSIRKIQVDAIALVSVIYFITFLGPFYVWILGQNITFPVFGAFVLVASYSILYKDNLKVNRVNFMLFLSYLFFLLIIHLPFREFEVVRLNFFIYIASAMYIFLDDETKSKALYFFYNIIFFIALLSIVSFVFHIFNIDMVFTEITMDGSESYPHGYDLHLGVAVLKNQYFNILGINLYRSSGWFAEPGHFAIYIILALILTQKILSGFKNIVMLLALLITFSGAGYVLAIVLLLIKGRSHFSSFFLMAIFIISLVFFIDVEFFSLILDRFFLSKFNSESVLQNRQTYDGTALYDLPFSDLFLGLGSLYFSLNDWTNSDFTGFIYRYGLIGLIGLIQLWLLIAYISIIKKNKVSYLFLLFVCLIFAHRSFMLINPFLIFLASSIVSRNGYLFNRSRV